MLSDRRPIVCLVTDRRRLCGQVVDEVGAERCVIAQVREAVEAQIELVQIRERGLEDARLAHLVSEAVAIARGTATTVVVNDRLDVAMACGAGGVHLRADSVPPSAARTTVPRGFLIGRSVHSAEEGARVAADVDYLIVGTVFASRSKPAPGPLLGEAGLAEVVRAVRVPVLAIGGVTIERLPLVAAAGAAGFAAIGLFVRAGADLSPCGSSVGAAVAAARSAFDSRNVQSLRSRV